VFILFVGLFTDVSAQSPITTTPAVVATFVDLNGRMEDRWIGRGLDAVVTADLTAMIIERPAMGRWRVIGTYDRQGTQLRVAAELVRADTSAVVAAIEVAGNTDDLFAVQDELVTRLRTRLSPDGEQLLTLSEAEGHANGRVELRDDPSDIDGPPAPVAPDVFIRDDQGRVTMRPTRLATPLVLDGRLDEDMYRRVSPVGNFVQQEPNEGQLATEQTEVWLWFDDDNIYIAARCWHSEPDRIVANEMKRDSYNMFGNEVFGVVIDPFYDRRNGYLFLTNALGGLFDATITNERSPNIDWNTVWDVQTDRFDGGWTLEMAIPFQSLRFPAGATQQWGINFHRRVVSKNEASFLTPIPAALSYQGLFKMSSAATLVGLDVPSAGSRFELKPYAIADLTTNLNASPSYADKFSGTGGLDMKYGVTDGLTADFTVNTDFAQVEVDEAQVNLTRFNLFFPEKREFFLEGQGIFEFGGGLDQDVTTFYFKGQMYGGEAPVLFFSRRIGLDDGRAVPIRGGGRLTGKTGPYSIGLLDVQTGSDEMSDANPTNFSVIRVKRDILRRSSIGGLFTGRSVSVDGQGMSSTYGVDGVFSFYDNLNINTYLAKTETPGRSGDDTSYQTELDYGGDRFGLRVERLAVGENFNPEIGFVRRTNFRRNFFQFRYSPRPAAVSSVRKFLFQPSLDYITDRTGTLETRLQQLLLGAEFENGDYVFAGVTDNYEFLKVPFQIAKTVAIPVGGYTFLDTRIVYALGQQRVLSGGLIFDRGEFFGGHKTGLGFFQPRVSMGPQFSVQPSMSVNWITLPQGAFTSKLASTRLTYTVTPRMFVSALMQYNSATESLGTNVRLRWEYRPGSELFLVYTDERDTLTPRFPGLQNRAFVVKFNRLLRF
jgi:TolB-like protein